MKPSFTHLPSTNRIAALAAGIFLTLATSWQAAAQVSLVSVQPNYDATDVLVNSTIVFTFSKPMDDTSLIILPENPFFSGSLAFSANLTSAPNFVVTWNAEFTVLTLDYPGNLPAGALVTWTINPPGTTLPLSSEDADQVPTTTGSFRTAGTVCDPDGIPDEYGGVQLFKTVTYLQTSTAAPVLKTDELPSFIAMASSPANNAVAAATVTKPGSPTPITLTNILGTAVFLHLSEYANQGLLDTAYPNGTYSFTLNRASGGPTQFSMPMPTVGSYPPVPQVSNFTQAQAIDPAQAFTLNFNALTGASGSDFIGLEISDSLGNPVLSAPDLCIPLPLANTATSFTIPADTLEAGKSYTVRLSFSRTFYSSTTAPPDFASFGALQRQTVLTIATTGGVVVPQPQITGAAFQGGFFAFNVGNLVAATTYQLQYSTTLLPGSWQNVQAVTISTPQPIFDLDSSENPGQRFYRVIKP